MREDPYAPRGVKSDIPVRKTEPKVVRYNPLHLSFKAGMKPAFDGVCVLYSDYEALDARVQELEEEVRVMERHELNENTRLREAAATSIRKCEQYWNEHNIPDAEVHAALELIHSALYAALKEKP